MVEVGLQPVHPCALPRLSFTVWISSDALDARGAVPGEPTPALDRLTHRLTRLRGLRVAWDRGSGDGAGPAGGAAISARRLSKFTRVQVAFHT